MSDHVWISAFPSNPDRGLWFRSDPIPGDQKYPASFTGRNESGEALGPEAFPKVLWTVEAAGGDYPEFPSLFQAWNCNAVTAGCAEVLRRFDLGAGNLYPVELLKLDRKTPYPGAYFAWNYGNRKDAFLADQISSTVKLRSSSGGGWNMPPVLKDNDFAVSATALAGPDVWVDPAFRYAFFLSSGLGGALIDAKLAGPFWLRRCRVIPG